MGLKSSVSYGKIDHIDNYEIIYNAATQFGSSGGPILNLNNYKVFGIHIGSIINNNCGTLLKNPINEFISNSEQNKIITNTKMENKPKDHKISKIDDSEKDNKNKSILELIKIQDKSPSSNSNYIYCAYIYDRCDEINLLHDYNLNTWETDINLLYDEAKEKNKKFLKENVDIYVEGKKVKFDWKFKASKETKKIITVKFIFKKNITCLSFLFYQCKYLTEIDLSSFNTTNVPNMSYMFSDSGINNIIGLSSINTIKTNNMEYMFRNCMMLQSLNLFFNCINVENMKGMFQNCYLLNSLNLNFNCNNVKDMSHMFEHCLKLKSLNLYFNTNNVEDMNHMFESCRNLTSIDLSSFNTEKVKNLSYMFKSCHSLKSINISSFKTENVENMDRCLKIVNL